MTVTKIALSIEEAADYTGIGRNTLRNLVEWKKLPVLRVGRKVLIKTDILETFMEANEGRDLRDITTATAKLALLISKVLTAARELKNRLFHEALEKEYGSEADVKTESITNVDTVPVTEEVTVSEPSSVTITAPVLKAEVAEPPNPPIPLRPVMPPETAAFPKLQKVMVTLDKHNNFIFEAESERNKLEIERENLKGFAKLTKKKELDSRISTQHFIPHRTPLTNIKKIVPGGIRPTERKPLQEPKTCTKRYNGIKKRLIGRMPVNLFETDIKGRGESPLNHFLFILLFKQVCHFINHLVNCTCLSSNLRCIICITLSHIIY